MADALRKLEELLDRYHAAYDKGETITLTAKDEFYIEKVISELNQQRDTDEEELYYILKAKFEGREK